MDWRVLSPFLISGVVNPARHLRSLLLRAGDIESNPGPTCPGCQRTIRVDFQPVICLSCQRGYHRSCSGLSRNHRRELGFTCGECAGRPSTPQPPVTTSSESRRSCVVCRTTIRTNVRPVLCCTCTAVAHRICSGIPRQSTPVDWKCQTCEPNSVQQPIHIPSTQRSNVKCPECDQRLTNSRRPLVCHLCHRGFHLKCAKETRSALERLRDADTWACESCNRQSVQPSTASTRKNELPRLKKNGLTILQWNCDYLATKIVELRDFVSRVAVDIIVLQETKLGAEDPTPRLPGYDAIRQDRLGSGLGTPRGGGLLTYVKQGLPYNEHQINAQGPLESQSVGIPTSNQLELRITNLYLPPEHSLPPNTEADHWFNVIPSRGPEVICGDLNAHHPYWDPFVSENRRGTSIQQWMEETGRASLNDGTATRYARYQQGPGCSVPDLTIVGSSETDHFTWTTMNELSSDHLPLLITWNKPVAVEEGKRFVKPNFRKANWPLYQSLVEGEIKQMDPNLDAPRRLEALVNILKAAAETAVPKKVLRKDEPPWMNAELKALTRERNKLRRDMRNNRQEWVKTNRLVLEKTKEARRAIWQSHLSSISEDKDIKKAWDVVKSLSGSNQSQAGKTLIYNGIEYASDTAKASAFVQEYAQISGKKSDKDTRQALRRLRRVKKGQSSSPRQEAEDNLTIAELRRAIWKTKAGKAAGPDGVAPEMLKNLPACAEEILLGIFNTSWMTSWCPQSWRSVLIVPILKKGKDPQDVSSYRPIALSSSIGKLCERMLTNRLSWWLEDENLLSPWQAGFRQNRSTTDQCLRLSQFISDGFQSTQRERCIATLFDFSKAYDTVWRTGLLTKMVDLGIPLRFVQWTSSWLTNRIARVRVNGGIGRPRVMKEGLPQGAVLSPLLFIVYINDLLGKFEEGTMVSAYADDLAIACRGRRKEDIEQQISGEVEKVVQWSKASRLTLNASKCEVTFFSLDSAEARWQPSVPIEERLLSYNPSPTFLGVKYDRQLTFGDHVQELCRKVNRRSNLLRLLGGKDWGWKNEHLRMVYFATQRAAIEYAAPAWTPWTSATNVAKLERLQLQAARSITAVVRSTPTEAVLCEAGLVPLRSRFEELSLRHADKWLQLPIDDPRRMVLLDPVRQRLRRTDWRLTVTPTLRRIGLLEMQLTTRPVPPPWNTIPPVIVRHTDVSKAAPVADQRLKTSEAITAIGPSDLLVFTDGSTQEPGKRGGAGFVVLSGETQLHSWHGPAGSTCSSYRAEKVAMEVALTWLKHNDDWRTTIVICDCKSLVDAIGNPFTSDEVVQAMQLEVTELNRQRRLHIMWGPGHCDMAGNDLADAQAKLGSTLPQVTAPMDVSTRRAVIRNEAEPEPPSHPRVASLFQNYNYRWTERDLHKADRIELARFRSGHHPKLRRWQHLVGIAESPECRFCAAEEESAEHLWLDCPALLAARQHLGVGFQFNELTRQPHRSLSLLRVILRRLG